MCQYFQSQYTKVLLYRLYGKLLLYEPITIDNCVVDRTLNTVTKVTDFQL